MDFIGVRIILYDITLSVICLLGDHLLSWRGVNGNIMGALIDDSTHGLVGFFSWAIVTDPHTMTEWIQCGLCFILASGIDVDHFIAARSFRLKDALSLNYRPFFHASSLVLSIVCVIYIAGIYLNSHRLKQLSIMCLVAWTSHHIRDGTRRGLWLAPFGSTPHIPYSMYIGLTMLLPVLLRAVILRYNSELILKQNILYRESVLML